MDSSGCDSNTDHKNSTNHVVEHSVCPQESTHCANQRAEVDGSKNTENEACQASRLSASEAAEEEETVPLCGKPYFTQIMTKSQVLHPYHLAMPVRFKSILPNKHVPVLLHYRDKTWEMNYSGDAIFKRFDIGWRKFVIDNDLRIDDACVFELIDDKNIKFRVQILRGDLPEAFIFNGQSPEKAVRID